MSLINITPVAGLQLAGVISQSAVKFVSGDHRLISGRPTVPADPGVAPSPGVVGRPPSPELPAVSGSVDSHVALLDESGAQIWSSRARLSEADYAAWNETDSTINDDDFITRKHAAALGLTPL